MGRGNLRRLHGRLDHLDVTWRGFMDTKESPPTFRDWAGYNGEAGWGGAWGLTSRSTSSFASYIPN